jgi:glycosidase
MNRPTNLNPINRRQFLRFFFLASGGVIITACRRGNSQTPSATATPTAETAGNQATCQTSLDGNNAEVWAWNKRLAGTVTTVDDCSSLILLVNGVGVPVTQEGRAFSIDIPLHEGENSVIAVCGCINGQEVTTEMLTLTGRLQQQPKAIIQLTLAGGRLTLDGRASQPDERDNTSIVEYVWTARPDNPAAVQLDRQGDFSGELSGQQINLTLPPTDGEYYFTLRVTDEAGRQDSSTTYVEVKDGAVRIPNYDIENPAWVERAIVYGVIPRNFGDPAFQAVVNRLDYLQELGINALWLAPVNVSPSGDYGYAIVDYFALNPNYGSKEDFRRLVQEAHARGIRVLMDLVPNHSSAEHPYFLNTLERGEESHYWEFYDRNDNGDFTHYFDWTHLPNLNYENPEVRRWMIEASAYWVREFDIDGYRVDVAWGIRERRPEFWMEWRRELKRIKPDLLLLAEASARDPFYFGNGFDAAYDWTLDLGHWGWEFVWGSYQHDLLTYNLDTALRNGSQGYHPDALIFRFLNNNDTGNRFISNHGEAMTRVATAMLLTLPGIPCIYTADEVGEFFRPYFDATPLSWEVKFPGLREYHQQLIALRKELPSLHSRHWQILEVEPHQQLFAYLRYTENNEQPIIVLLNFFDEELAAEIQLPAEFQAIFSSDLWFDLLAGEPVTLTNSSVPVGSFGVRLLTPRQT